MAEQKSYLTVKQVPGRFPAFTESSIRWVIFNGNQNGFDKVTRRIGRKILIDEAAFVEWIESKRAV